MERSCKFWQTAREKASVPVLAGKGNQKQNVMTLLLEGTSNI